MQSEDLRSGGRRYFAQVDVSAAALRQAAGAGSDRLRIPLLPEGKFSHPWYGTLDWNAERLQRMVDHHNRGVLGVTPMLNFDHQGGAAAGWLPAGAVAYQPGQGLVGDVDLTELGKEAVGKQFYRYISAEWWDTYTDSQGNKYPDVLAGAALTNTPFHTTMPGLFAGAQPACFSRGAGVEYWVSPAGKLSDADEEACRDLARSMGCSVLEARRRFLAVKEERAARSRPASGAWTATDDEMVAGLARTMGCTPAEARRRYEAVRMERAARR